MPLCLCASVCGLGVLFGFKWNGLSLRVVAMQSQGMGGAVLRAAGWTVGEEMGFRRLKCDRSLKSC